MKQPNAQLVVNSRDRLSNVNGVTVSQPYNNFNLTKVGQNIIQGNIDRIQVAEVRFPYDIPNVFPGITDRFRVEWTGPLTGNANVILDPGFYTGDELEAAINAELQIVLAAIPVNERLECAYQPSLNAFSFTSPLNNYTYVVRNVDFAIPATQTYKKSLLWIMGDQNSDQAFTIGPTQNLFLPFSAPLIFTDFIDIVSSKLCGNVYIRDGSTCQTTVPFRRDLLARLYIADETSTNNQAAGAVQGTRPFVIHRQFKNSKMIPNTIENSLNDVDIQLIDDQGNPIPFTIAGAIPFPGATSLPVPRDFQITLNVYEPDEMNDRIKHAGGGPMIPYR